eukprot:5690-Heterococcus_DN1.PRE.1
MACHFTTMQLQPVNHLSHHSCSGDWTDGYLLTTSPADRRRVNFAAFAYTTAFNTSSSSSSSGSGAYTLVTGGTGHVKFWNLHGRCLTAQLGIQQACDISSIAAHSDTCETTSTACTWCAAAHASEETYCCTRTRRVNANSNAACISTANAQYHNITDNNNHTGSISSRQRWARDSAVWGRTAGSYIK